MKRSRTSSGSKSPTKRARGTIGAISSADLDSRLIAATHLSEHSGQGKGYLSIRPDPSTSSNVISLRSYSLKASAEGILNVLKIPAKPLIDHQQINLIGWDKNNHNREEEQIKEMSDLREFIKTLPIDLSNKLLELVLNLANQQVNNLTPSGSLASGRPDDSIVSVLGLANLFLHSNTTKLSLSSLSAPTIFLNKLVNCTSLQYLDLSSHAHITDLALSKVLALLPTLQVLVLRGCCKAGDLSCIQISRAAESRLKSINLSMCAVTIKGLSALFARCSALEVLKIANVASLNDKAIMKLVDDSTRDAGAYRHFPLSNLQTLKLRSTEISDASLGRLLALCSLSLTSLDISYTNVKSLDILSQALFTRTTPWKLQKLVASGLPLAPSTLKGFLQPLSELPDGNIFHTLKLGSMLSSSNKIPGLNDAVLKEILPYLENLIGLEHISLYQNYGLGRSPQPLGRFMEVVGKRCKTLDLTISLEDYHLDGLFPPAEYELEDLIYAGESNLEVLILNSSRITDKAARAIGECKKLRSLHIAETKISTAGLTSIMNSCPLLSTVNLTSCRGIELNQRRNWFECWKKGEIVSNL